MILLIFARKRLCFLVFVFASGGFLSIGNIQALFLKISLGIDISEEIRERHRKVQAIMSKMSQLFEKICSMYRSYLKMFIEKHANLAEETNSSGFEPIILKQTPQNDKDRLGIRGENEAASYLLNNGYTILFRNCKFPSCEIDIIANPVHSQEIVFIEVKTKRMDTYGDPFERVDLKRVKKMKGAAREYVHWQRCQIYIIHFDIISILWLQDEEPCIKHLKDVFGPYTNIN